MHHKKGILFDMDGTLLDTLNDISASVNNALKENGLKERTRDEVRSFLGNGAAYLMEKACDLPLDNEKVQRCLKRHISYYSENDAVLTQPFEGVIDCLRELKEKGYLLGVVSNKEDSQVKDLSEKYFGDLMDLAIGRNDSLKKKPAGDMLEYAINQWNLAKEEVLYIGDMDIDLKTAENAGVECIIVLWGYADYNKFNGNPVFIEKAEDLVKILEES